jgi:FkbM family methyltransferase
MLNSILKKHALPAATRLFALPGLSRLPPLLEATGAALQSKRGGGYAATWQEIEGVLNFVTSPAPLIFDIGANVGNWTRGLLKDMPDVRRVVMFEPQPSCWPTLEKIRSDRITFEPRAVSDTHGTATLWANPNPEISSLYQEAGGGPNSHPVTVETITIDDFIAEHGIDTVDYIKIDVEGHELAVMKGASRSIAQRIVKAFSFEFGQADVASRTFFRDMWQFITNFDLDLYRLGHDGFAVHVPRYSYELESFGGVANYVAAFQQPKRRR